MGEVERVPLKVVPIFVQPIEEEPPVEDDILVEEPFPRKRPVYVAFAAAALALGTIGVHIAAIVVASAGEFVTGTLLGYVAIGLSALAVLTAIGALVVGRLRVCAIAAGILAILANPIVLLVVLRFLSGLQTA